MPLKLGITGNRGFIAKHLFEHLDSLNHKVFDLDPALKGNRVELPKKINSIFHLAARSDIQEAFNHPGDILDNNLKCLLDALQLSKSHGARFIFFSSYTYGQPQTSPISEEHPQASLNPYMGSKLLGEALAKEFCRWSDMELVILRPFSIYGNNMRPGRLVSDLIYQAKSGGPLNLRSPDPIRDYLHVKDLCRLCEKIIHTPLKKNQDPSFNVGSGFQCSNLELAQHVKDMAGISEEILIDQIDRRGDVFEVIPALEKVKSTFDWEPTISLKEGLIGMLKAP